MSFARDIKRGDSSDLHHVWVKVMGKSWRSQEKNIAKVVGAASVDGVSSCGRDLRYSKKANGAILFTWESLGHLSPFWRPLNPTTVLCHGQPELWLPSQLHCYCHMIISCLVEGRRLSGPSAGYMPRWYTCSHPSQY